MLSRTLSISLALAWTVLVVCPSWADVLVRVVLVQEGDRVTVYYNGKNESIYLKDIDCPDLKQPYGRQAKRVTTAYVGGREVIVRGLKRDTHGRTTAEILLIDGRNLGYELVKEGLAWAKRTQSNNHGLGEVEELARAERKGLWSDPNPVPPWQWKAPKTATRKFSN
jgi:endonuclease YncB( thermonuclease family)